MAEYTNLTSLEGLSPGDTVTYNTTTAIDFAGYKAKVELYGCYSGGYTSFIIDTSLLPQKILSFNNSGTNANDIRNDLIYGDTDDLYYRIAVAGNGGTSQSGGSGESYRGSGGGITGGQTNNSYRESWYVTGGTQTTGGKLNTSAYNYSAAKHNDGSFGLGGDRIYYSITNSSSGYGGYGWYGGGTAECKTSGSASSYFVSGSGGSGFIIGTSTTTYPSGYLGDDTTLQSTIASAITEGALKKGASSGKNPRMVLTIIEVGSSESSQSIISYYNGTEFVNTNIKYYNGTSFVDCDAYYYDGTEFKKI